MTVFEKIAENDINGSAISYKDLRKLNKHMKLIYLKTVLKNDKISEKRVK